MTSNRKQRQSIGKWARWLIIVIAVMTIIYLLVWHVPDALARRHTNPSVESAYISAVATLLGVGATAAVAIFAFWYSRSTNRATIDAAKAATDVTVRAARETNQATLEATREGQLADRYSRAIEQLGSHQLDVRIGSIYALERIARDSARDHPTVMEILAAFIREQSHEQWPLHEPGADLPPRTTRPDVQAAATVIGRRKPKHDRQLVNLRRADLIQSDLADAQLKGADLTGAQLKGADLTRAQLKGADLTGADLSDADLSDADLTGAYLTGAQLIGAHLTFADLTKADLTDADLTRANLMRARLAKAKISATFTDANLMSVDLTGAQFGSANLSGVDLNGANLTGAQLHRANFTGAFLDEADLTSAEPFDADLTGARWSVKSPPPTGWVCGPADFLGFCKLMRANSGVNN